MRFLLDTNALSEVIRKPQGRAAQRMTRVGERNVCTSIIVAAELRYGVAKRRSPQLAARVEAVLAAIDIEAFKKPADAIYATIRARLEAAGRPIGGNDFLIAAHALALGCTLVTSNEREFGRVEGLAVESWSDASQRK
jgi:tRNA(fMet)-specific endonuclease VapC